jgi:general stress protein YciG
METTSKGGMTVKEAGRKGGQSTAKTHNHKFYEEIGHKGGLKGGSRVRELIQKGKESERR